ncbi:DUF4255 domain-containing protein [Rhodococcus spelaei]|uniref:DUF4255 domain-containing protein n=1 Tax=Rhodococcus spelaei TaxID=2546320 RepID=A0A541B7I4_9NOCA|nr:DUF4255 domain-containing protein [Rhodococcus spelaei]TQF68281.1 DUF4255 domain-containing protein [Rhodococcus spelaei]
MQDLSLVTDTLITILTTAVNSSPLWGGQAPPFSIVVSGQHPEQPATSGDCDLNLYLFHVSIDKFLANAFWTQQGQSGGPKGLQPVAFEPLCLDLWYLLSAQSSVSYAHEQQVLGVAMQAFHEHGTITLDTPTPPSPPAPPPGSVTPSEASLVLEAPTFDELSRLWQALGVPLRTTAQYRVSVVFITPEDLPAPQPPVLSMTLFAAPTAVEGPLPRLFGTIRRVSYVVPAAPGQPLTREFDQAPAATAPAPTGVAGQEFWLRGEGLTDTDRVLLVAFGPGGVETTTDITDTWKVPLVPPYPSPPSDGVPFLLRPPDAPGACPPPGRYELRILRPTVSGGVPVDIAAWVDPSGGPLVTAGPHAITVANVPDTGAELRLGTVPLERIASGSTPAAGQWQRTGTTLTFAAPTDLAAGRYPVRLRAGDIESDPALWVELP